MLTPYLEKLTRFENLTTEETINIIENMLNQDNEIQAGALLSLMRAKGETVEEIYGLYQILKNHMNCVPLTMPVLDIVGTGGDKTGTVNISTASALLAASCGVKILKHGNRAISSQCGSADLLEALGININLPREAINACIQKTNFGFCFAPNFHPTFLKLSKLRRALAIPTAFNLMGPLLNPGCAEYLMLGVYKKELLEIFGELLIKIKIKHALIFHTLGSDEIFPCKDICGVEIKNNEKKIFNLKLDEFDIASCHLRDLQGGDIKLNVQLVLNSFSGKKGSLSDTFILNAGIACYLYGVTPSIAEGILLARNNLFEGKALENLRKIIFVSNSLQSEENKNE
jgi:anthranilate phosphoribosyltransferase